MLPATRPPASERAEVIGDPCLDVMLANRHRRARYRHELGIGHRQLVVLTSTFGNASLLGHQPDLPQRVAAALDPDLYLCCVLTHPGITAVHSHWQLDAWLETAHRLGTVRIANGQRWEPILLAADCVIADQGSISMYAAALDLPLITAGGNSPFIPADSVVAALATRAPSLTLDLDLQDQVEAAIASHEPGEYADLVARVFDGPGTFTTRMRALCYRLMNLAEPDTGPSIELVDLPAVSAAPPSAFAVAVRGDPSDLEVSRRPAAAGACQWPAGADRHLAVHAQDGPAELVHHADLLYLDPGDCRSAAQFCDWAAAALRTWPAASMAAWVMDATRCLVVARDGTPCELVITDKPGTDDPRPQASGLVLASWAYARHHRGQTLEGVHHARLLQRPTTIVGSRPW
jgi:hypothetical protein